MFATDSNLHDVERAQAVMRLIIMSIAICYTLVLFHHSVIGGELVWNISLLATVFWVAALTLWFDIRRRPGNRPVRRMLAILIDYSTITLAATAVGAAMLPIYVVLICITIDYGLRYGSWYRVLTTIMAMVSLVIIASTSAYWQSQPYLIATLLLTTLMVPAYIHALLKRSRRATEAEQAANLAKSQFLAQASHDLRQPIHSISLFTACLRDSSLDTEQKRLVENIDKSLHSVARLFRSILDIYSLDSGKVVAQMEVLPLHTLLQHLIQQNTEAARWAGVDIRLHCPPTYVRADHGLLTTMLQNLLSNALKYAPGQPVLIGCRRRSTGLSIELYDKGHGIAASHLENIFEEFYRVRQACDSDVEGMGLGLTIVRRLATLMDLRIRIRSVEGRGTLAAIDGLRRVAPPVERAAPAQGRIQTPRMLDGWRVCLIEDDQNALLATATLLEKWGCEVATFTSLPDVSCDYDLVVTDFDLGRAASGAECINHVRALSGRNVPAIIMTGHDAHRVQQQLSDDGIAILSKPVQPAELRSLLVALKLGSR